jgi:hypothetical protein
MVEYSNSGAFARQVRDRRWIALALLIPPDVQVLLHL